MKKFLFALPLIAALAVPVLIKSANADDTPAETHAKGDHHTGILSAKPADAKDGVVAVLTSKHHNEEKTFNLIATGDLATQIAGFMKNGTKVMVKGAVTDGAITVTAVEVAKEHVKKTN